MAVDLRRIRGTFLEKGARWRQLEVVSAVGVLDPEIDPALLFKTSADAARDLQWRAVGIEDTMGNEIQRLRVVESADLGPYTAAPTISTFMRL
jgi:hypothetical protein